MLFDALDKFDSHSSVLPLFRKTRNRNAAEQFASAVLVKWHGDTLLLTAAHVTDELRSESEVLVPIDGGILAPLRGDFRFVDVPPDQLRSEDALDIAYVRLTSDLARCVAAAFSPVPTVAIESLPFEFWRTGSPRVCSATGYPASKARRDGGAHAIDIWSYAGMLVTDHDTYDRLGYSTDLNILLHYDRTQTINSGHPELRIASAPSLKGVSGGGIFSWPEIVDKTNPSAV